MEILVTFQKMSARNKINDNSKRETYRINADSRGTGFAIDSFKQKTFGYKANQYCIVGHDFNPKEVK